ncbi:MAG: hypothetical protein LBD73_04565 [Deferribacteraceae bacterium]|jgi:hypothetical protein|nr:hypothetical protein [Deferribacteraceae bacterium]
MFHYEHELTGSATSEKSGNIVPMLRNGEMWKWRQLAKIRYKPPLLFELFDVVPMKRFTGVSVPGNIIFALTDAGNELLKQVIPLIKIEETDYSSLR